MKNKENFNKAISYIKREGIESFIEYLETTDFFTAPASTKFHGNHEGGLLDHSLYVLKFALHNFNLIVAQNPDLEYLKESVIISALFHDICKVNSYEEKELYTKDNNGKWKTYKGWVTNDKFPMPHGPKSIYIISKYIKLTDAEALAIAWHQGASDLNQPDSMSKFAFEKAWDHPLVKIIMAADILATALEEKIDLKNN